MIFLIAISSIQYPQNYFMCFLYHHLPSWCRSVDWNIDAVKVRGLKHHTQSSLPWHLSYNLVWGRAQYSRIAVRNAGWREIIISVSLLATLANTGYVQSFVFATRACSWLVSLLVHQNPRVFFCKAASSRSPLRVVVQGYSIPDTGLHVCHGWTSGGSYQPLEVPLNNCAALQHISLQLGNLHQLGESVVCATLQIINRHWTVLAATSYRHH